MLNGVEVQVLFRAPERNSPKSKLGAHPWARRYPSVVAYSFDLGEIRFSVAWKEDLKRRADLRDIAIAISRREESLEGFLRTEVGKSFSGHQSSKYPNAQTVLAAH